MHAEQIAVLLKLKLSRYILKKSNFDKLEFGKIGTVLGEKILDLDFLLWIKV